MRSVSDSFNPYSPWHGSQNISENRGGTTRSSSAPIFASPCQSPNHIDTTLYVDTTHFCHHRVAPFLSSQSCTILSSYCHHIVIDVFDTMLYHIDTTLYVDSTILHHIVIILSSYCNWCLWYHVISYWYHPICRLNPSLSSPSCIILSSHHHHIVIILSSTSSCCTLYLPSQNYTILPYCNILDIL